MDSNFDILDYLNDMYMNKIIPSIDVNNAGGYHNIHHNENQAQEEISEKNKKRIHIPNAEIKYFQLGQPEDDEEHYEEEDTSSSGEQSGEDGTGYNEVFSQGAQKGSSSRGYTDNIVQISEKNPIKKTISTGGQQNPSQDLII